MKKFLRPLNSVWVGLTTHKLRSFLTMLGIIIGVASVIALMSIGRGTTQRIISNITSMGTNLVTIRAAMQRAAGGVVMSSASGGTLTVADATAIGAQVQNVKAVAPVSNSASQLIAGNQNTFAQIIGTTTDYQAMNNLNIASGSFFTDAQYKRATKVVVLGSTVASTLFPDPSVSPIGQKVRLGSQAIATVVGVLESKGGSFNSVDNNALIPLTFMQESLSRTKNAQGQQVVNTVVVEVIDEKLSEQTVTDITDLLRTRHKLAESASDDFSITSMSEMISSLEETTSSMTLLLGAIAAIALLVGGIGVMNIMLVSVLERTREIGIRKALGAKNREIWMQFLLEASFLTLAGGIIGVVVGWGAAYIVNRTGFMPTLVTADIVILSVAVAIGIGIFFGFYPAWNASRLDPIQALRSE